MLVLDIEGTDSKERGEQRMVSIDRVEKVTVNCLCVDF